MDKLMLGYMHKSNNNVDIQPTIIKHASILPPDEYALGKGLNECCSQNIGVADCTPYLHDDIVNNLPDDIIITPNFTKPNELNERREYYRAQIGVFYCLICGNEMPWYEGQPAKVKVCDECRKAMAQLKEYIREKEDVQRD